MYNKGDIIRFISIKCDVKISKANEMLNAFYEFIEYNLKNGDMVSLQPIGSFKFSNCDGWEERTMECPLVNGTTITTNIPFQPPFTRVKFKVNKNISRYIREKTTNNQFKLLEKGQMYRDLDPDYYDDEDDAEDEEEDLDG